MELMKRDFYLEKLKGLMSTPDIKVVTGIRRSGKSKLLEVFQSHVLESVANANIINVNFNLPEYDELRTYKKLYDYVNLLYRPGAQNFVFIDEVQMCEEFERAVNGLHARGCYDIYITGSNAFLLSSDLATLFTGRTFDIEIYPFSFAEFMQYFGLEDKYEALNRYIIEGGMAGSYLYTDIETKYDYIRRVFDTLILRDISDKHNIRNPQALEKLTNFMMDNISNLTTVRKIANKLAGDEDNVSHTTVGTFIQYLCHSFAFYSVPRFDIKGKRYLANTEKYYLCDHSFRYARLATKNMDYGRTLENIVAIDLMRRGYQVYVGVLQNKEIDFVAIKRSEQLYIQVSDNIDDPRTFEREVDPLLKIADGYPKILLSRTRHDEYQYEGIKVIDIADWLLRD